MDNLKVYTGGCHCGKVRYEATGDFSSAISCNCSHCGKKGFLLAFVAPEQFKLLEGDEALSEYWFNKKVIRHQFCKHCGVESFSSGAGPGGKKMFSVNLRCLDDVDLSSVKVKAYDGKHH